MSAAPALTQKQISAAEQAMPMWKIVLSQFVEHRAAVIGLFIIFVYMLIALGAPLIQQVTGLDPELQNPLSRYQKPMTTTFASPDQREDAAIIFQKDDPTAFAALGDELVAKHLVTTTVGADAVIEFFKKDSAELISEADLLPDASKTRVNKMIKSFQIYHVFGTDELGRDVLIRLVFGTRVSMGAAVLVTIASAIIGLLIGALAGYHGGFIDTALMRFTDALLSIPTIPIMILFAAIDLDKVPGARAIITNQNENVLKLVFILILFSWMQVARLVRGSILSLREREFILAAKTMGATDSTIIFRHLLPNVIAPLLVSVTLGVGNAILSEAALSYLGLGIQPPTPSWGNMLFNAQELISEAPFLAVLPGLNILAVVMSFNYLGDGLQDAIDPKAIRR